MSFLLASCIETLTDIDDTIASANLEKSVESMDEPGDSCTFSGILSEADIAGLYEMREEEKLARDVYTNLY